jgi:receptor expression-enhancing protein 5/6
VPKVYVVMGIGVVYFFLIFLNYGGQLLTNLAGFIVPGYYSLNALFTASKVDDTQWLTYELLVTLSILLLTILPHRYWVVFAFFSVVEAAFAVTYWFPFYFIFKFALIMWLGLPQFGYVLSILQPLSV